MEKFMTTKEASEKWNITERRINVLCKVFFERSKEDTSVYFKDKKSGGVAKNIGIIRGNIRLYM